MSADSHGRLCLDQFEFVPGIFPLARFWADELRRPIVVGGWAIASNGKAQQSPASTTCPYHPLHGIGEYRRDHPWRKPKPGMILRAVSDLGLDSARCVIVGDQMSDIEAGTAAGLGLRILIPARPGERKEGAPLHEVVADLSEALALLRSRFATTAAGRRSGPS